MDDSCCVVSPMLMYASAFMSLFLGGLVFLVFFFLFFFVRFRGGRGVCFVVGCFFIWPNSVQRRLFFMPGIYKLPATSAYMLQLLYILH